MRRSTVPLVLAGVVLGCGGAHEAYEPALPRRTGDAVVAGVITGAAVVTYAAAGGCRIAECPADTVCNAATERCERIECSGPRADADVCPPSSQCSSTTGTCVPF